MNIGNVKIENNVFLAPMAGVTDMPFRILCRRHGCGFSCTEMVSTKAMHYNDKKTIEMINIGKQEQNISVQIFGNDPYIMACAVEKLNKSKALFIDINMGCPAKKIVNNKEGSALMKNPELAGAIIKEVVLASDKPVTVKIRKGWDDNNVNAVEIAKIAEANGAAAVTVHGRTRIQFYSGSVDFNIIKKVKQAISIPVIGNGDVFSGTTAKNMFDETGCDAIMVGRASMGNPWIFSNIASYLKTGVEADPPPNYEKFKLIKEHIEMMVKLKGEKRGMLEMRKHLAWYVKGIRGASAIKNDIFKLEKEQEGIFLIANFLAENKIKEKPNG